MRLPLSLALLAATCLSITTVLAADVAAPDECVGPLPDLFRFYGYSGGMAASQ